MKQKLIRAGLTVVYILVGQVRWTSITVSVESAVPKLKPRPRKKFSTVLWGFLRLNSFGYQSKMRGSYALLLTCLVLATTIEARRKLKREESFESGEEGELDATGDYDDDEVEPCQCGVFLSQQIGIKPGRRSRPRGPPQGEPVVTYDTDEPSLPCGGSGNKYCISKCLDVILKYLPKAGPVVCGAVERDVHREKAFLFIRNCGAEWIPTSFSAGKEFCCTDGQHHKC